MAENSDIIAKKLDIIIKLLALTYIKGKASGTQILFLHNLGISNIEIANILDKKPNTVSVTIHQAKKRKKKNGK